MHWQSFNYYVEGRVFEWCMGVAMIAVGVESMIFPQIVDAGGLLLAVVTPATVSVILLMLGWSRCAALMLNGQALLGLKLGPWVRAIAGVLSAILWAQFVVALIELSIVRGVPSPGIPFWIMFTAGEIYTAYTTVKNG